MAVFNVLCQIFKSKRNPEMYLYVEKTQGLERVRASLLHRFGDPEPLMMIVLEVDKRLARANAEQVLQEIKEHGFYLQMPPTTAELLRRDGAA